jgi:hypothetical protein
MPPPAVLHTKAEVIDRVFWQLLGRAPSAAERQIADAAVTDSSLGDRPSARGLADLIWALTMKPEFQLIY